MNPFKKIDRKYIEDIIALTPMQEGMLFHYLKNPDGNHYFEQLCLDISGTVDIEIFKKTWNFIIEQNEMLRALFQWEKLKNPVQIFLKEHKIQPEYYDFSDRVVKEGKKCLEELTINDSKKKFDLRDVPFRITLCKIEKDKYTMIISNHHILYDGWSNGILLKEFFNAYTDFVDLKEPEKPVKTKFKEFVKWIQDQDGEKQEKFWRNYLKGFDTQKDLSIRKRRKGKELVETKNFQILFAKDIKRELERFVKRYKLTSASLLYTVWGILLQKYNNTDDVVFGTTVSGRSAKVQGIEEMVGLFINTLPLRIQSSPGEKIEDLLYRIDHSLQQREEHETTSLVDIKEFSELNTNEELFDSIVVIENYPFAHRLIQEKGQLSVDSFSMVEMTHYDLTIGITIIEEIEVSFIYNEGVFDHGSIKNMSRHFLSITEDIIKNPDKKVSDIEIISEDEKKRLLFEFNNTDADYPNDKTVHQLFEEQVGKTGDRVAVIGMEHGAWGMEGTETLEKLHAITYNELNKKSNQSAYLLKEKGVGPETIVGIMIERSLEMVVGIMAILKAGGAYMPIDPNYPENRIKYMLADSSIGILLTTRNLSERIALEKEILYLDSYKRFGPVGASSEKRHAPCSRPHASQVSFSLAYVIYTSGSTGTPRGTLIRHSAVVNRLFWMQKKYRFSRNDVILHQTPFTFDVSVCELFRWMLGGARICLLAVGGEKDPEEMVKAIHKNKVTTIDFMPSMLELFLDFVDHGDMWDKLSSLRYVFTGVERLSSKLVKTFNENLNQRFNTRLMNLYGTTETTVDMTYFDCTDFKGSGSVPIGKPMDNVRVYIVDKDNNLQPPGLAGELWISGDSLARGYLNRPELTAEKFDQDFLDYLDYQDKKGDKLFKGADKNPLTSLPHYPSTSLYHTGDLARWLPDGNIEFLGRIDLQIKVRGFRVEPGEIENRLLHHEKVKEAVVIDRESGNGDKYLCAYIVGAGGEIDARQLRDYLSVDLPNYMIPSYFVRLDRLPLTSAGKPDRKALPEPEAVNLEAGVGYIAPSGEVEKKLVEIWARILGIEKDIFGLDSNFFKMGGHSLKATALVSKIHKELNVKVPLPKVFQLLTIRKLAQYIRTTSNDQYASIEPAEEKEYYPLSSAQKRLYVLHQVDETSTRYNMSTAMRIEGALDINKVEEAFKRLIRRHESFRTSFEMKGSEPIQVIHKNAAFVLEWFDLTDIGDQSEQTEKEKIEKQVVKNFFKGFDLSCPPLLRAGLIKTAEEKYILMVDMHHIISDEASVNVMEQEFWALYKGEESPESGIRIRIEYKDFSEWQNRLLDSRWIRKQEEYWLDRYKGDIPVLNMPTDFPRPLVTEAEGSTISFEIDREITAGIKRLIWETETTMFIVLLAAYNVLLSKYSGQEDIIIGSPIAGRRHPDLENIIGLFANMLALRNQPRGEKTFREFLEDVKINALNAYENQEYQFETLVWNLKLKVDPGRNPLFDAAFVLRNAAAEDIEVNNPEELNRLKVLPYKIEQEKVHNELILAASEGSDRLLMSLDYSRELFKESTAWKISNHYIEILEKILGDRDIKLKDIKISHGLIATKSHIILEEQDDFRF